MSETRRRNEFLQERFEFDISHGELTVTTTVQGRKLARAFVVERVTYYNETGLAEDDTDIAAASLEVAGGDPVSTLFNTDSAADDDASLDADTFLLPALTDTVNGAAGDVLQIVFTLGGSPTLPAGRATVYGRYL